MKLFLLKALLQRRARDEGFTLPMVIALGLVMILLGTTNIVKSSEENINAINQNSSSDALAIAEVGITKYRELLNQNRILTVYNHDQWTSNSVSVGGETVDVAGQTCSNMTETPAGWFDDDDSTTNVAPNSTTQWWEIKQNYGDDPIGRYKLVSYEYDIDGDSIREDRDNNGTLDDTTPNDENGDFAPNDDNPNTTDSFTFNDSASYNPRGILTVQGQSTDGSEAQIQVEIPLRINDFDNLKPILWVGGGSITNAGGAGDLNLTNGNIVFSNPGGGCPSVAAIDGNTVINDARDLPDIIADPSSLPAGNKNDGIGSISIDSTTPGSVYRLPRAVSIPDKKNSDGRFLYVLTGGLSITDKNFVTDGTAKVTLYVGTSISITNTIVGGTSMNIGSFNPLTTNVSSHNLEIYGDSSLTAINIDPGNGTVNIEAFIHAPNATLNITGDGIVNINGAVWVNDIDNSGGATVNIVRDQTDTTTSTESSYKFYTTSATRTPRPITSSPTNWVREEVE